MSIGLLGALSSDLDVQIARMAGSVDRKVVLGLGTALALFFLYVGMRTSVTIIMVLVGCLLMLWFASYLAGWVLKKDEGPKEMQEVSPFPV